MRCQICGKNKAVYEFYESRFSLMSNIMTWGCARCFTLWKNDKWDEIYNLISLKIGGKKDPLKPLHLPQDKLSERKQ